MSLLCLSFYEAFHDVAIAYFSVTTHRLELYQGHTEYLQITQIHIEKKNVFQWKTMHFLSLLF